MIWKKKKRVEFQTGADSVLRIDLHSLEVYSIRPHEWYHADNASTHPWHQYFNAVRLIGKAPSALPQTAIQNRYYIPISEYSRRSYSALTALTAVSQD